MDALDGHLLPCGGLSGVGNDAEGLGAAANVRPMPTPDQRPLPSRAPQLVAGEQIDHLFGAKLGLSVLASAGLGNMVADVVAQGLPNSGKLAQHWAVA